MHKILSIYIKICNNSTNPQPQNQNHFNRIFLSSKIYDQVSDSNNSDFGVSALPLNLNIFSHEHLLLLLLLLFVARLEPMNFTVTYLNFFIINNTNINLHNVTKITEK